VLWHSIIWSHFGFIYLFGFDFCYPVLVFSFIIMILVLVLKCNIVFGKEGTVYKFWFVCVGFCLIGLIWRFYYVFTNSFTICFVVRSLNSPATYAGNDAIVAFARLHHLTVVIHQLNSPLWEVDINILRIALDKILQLWGPIHEANIQQFLS